MRLAERLLQQLKTIRGLSERILADFHTPSEYTYQVYPQTNHALWFAGHMGLVDNFMLRQFDAREVREPAGYREKFGMGTRPTDQPGDYPPAAEVLAFMRERRETLLGLVAGLSDEQLAAPCPPGMPPFATDIASLLEMAVWHEALHAGQVTVIRRALGHPPLVDAPPKNV